MTEQLTDLLGGPAEIVRARTPEPRTHRCPRCCAFDTTSGFFFVAAIDDGRGLPFCRDCIASLAPTLGATVDSLNVLAMTLPDLELRHLVAANNILHFTVREAYAGRVPEAPSKAARAAVSRAVRAMISRQAHGITDISVRETVDTADVYEVIEALATIAAGPVKQLAGDDVAGWLQQLFESADEDGDEPA